MTAYAEIMEHERETQALGMIAARLGWDQDAKTPPGAADQRGEEMAAIEGVLHARTTLVRVGDWLATATGRLRANLHAPRETVARAIGAEPHQGPPLDQVEARFADIDAL